MPTGFTQMLIDRPDMTFAEFALLCTRAFGVAVEMRDEPLDKPIPERFEVPWFYKQNLEAAEVEVRRLESMTKDHLAKVLIAHHEERAKDAIDVAVGRKKAEREDAILTAMLERVEAWTPPTKEHESLKEFMVEQLRTSLHGDSSRKYYEERQRDLDEERKIDVEVETLYREKLQRAREDVARCRKSYEDALKQVELKNQWLRTLRESLAKAEPR